jgi:hypothetical protein
MVCALEYRSYLARQRDKVKTLITDDDDDHTLGELLLDNIRCEYQLAHDFCSHMAFLRNQKPSSQSFPFANFACSNHQAAGTTEIR